MRTVIDKHQLGEIESDKYMRKPNFTIYSPKEDARGFELICKLLEFEGQTFETKVGWVETLKRTRGHITVLVWSNVDDCEVGGFYDLVKYLHNKGLCYI